jgi:hypothetical protein
MPSNTYDPTAAQPYQAYQPPEPAAPPPPVPQSQPFQFTGAPISKAGAAAGLLDNIFKGYMNGKAAAAQKVAGQFKAKSDNLRASYEQDAQRLDGLARSGAKPGDAEYDTAVSAVQGSWGAMKEWQDKIINGPDGNKPKKSKKSAQGQGQQSADQPQTPQQQLQQLAQDAKSPDPKVKLAALHKIDMMKGPPVLWQIKQYQSPEYQAQRQTAQLGGQHELSTAQAQATIDELVKTPQSQWTQPQREQYKQAYGVVNPPKIEDPKPGDETKMALDEVVKRISQPGYKLTDADKDIFRANKINIDPKSKLHVTSRGEIIEEHDDGTYDIKRGVQKAYEPRGEGGASGGSMEKKFREDVNFLMNHHPGMTRAEAEAQAMPTVEGVAGTSRDINAKNAKDDPDQFANDVTTVAVGKLRDLPQYKKMDDDTFDGAIASIVGRTNNDGEDAQYQYRQQSGKDQIQPDSKGMYSGNLDHEGLVRLEADLQNQIRDVLKSPNLRGLTSDELNAVKGRLKPLWVGNSSSAGSTVTPGSPQAGAATPAPASSPAQGGKSQFMAIPNPKGLREPGNIPIWDRPTVQNADGTHSSEYSTSFRDEKTGNEVLVPTVVNGKFLTPDGKKPREGSSEEKAMFQKAWQHYLQTGENLGKFDNPHDADSYANVLHNRGNQSGKGGKSDEPRERKIYQHGQLHGTIKLTDAEAKQLADDADFKAQGGTIK